MKIELEINFKHGNLYILGKATMSFTKHEEPGGWDYDTQSFTWVTWSEWKLDDFKPEAVLYERLGSHILNGIKRPCILASYSVTDQKEISRLITHFWDQIEKEAISQQRGGVNLDEDGLKLTH